MIILTVDEIIEIHSLLIKKTGGLDGLRDKGLLESAVFSISSGFGDIVLHNRRKSFQACFWYCE